MKLTGKCEYDFNEWIIDNCDVKFLEKFYYLPLSMQFGVYVDFFDSVGLNILLTVEFDWGYVITEHKYQEIEEVKKWYDTRDEARTESLKKAIEIYNKK